MNNPLTSSHVKEVGSFQSLQSQIRIDVTQTKKKLYDNILGDIEQGKEISANTEVNATQTVDISTLFDNVQNLKDVDIATDQAISAINQSLTAIQNGYIQNDNALLNKIEEVEGKIPSLEGYATEEWVENQAYLTEHQSLDHKADVSALEALDNIVKTKATKVELQSTVNTINSILSTKADKSAMVAADNELDEKIDTKADQSALEAAKSELNSKIDTKADLLQMMSAHAALEGKINLKADATDLAAVSGAVASHVTEVNEKVAEINKTTKELKDLVDTKPDSTLMNSIHSLIDVKIDTKADKSTVDSLNESIKTKLDSKADLSAVTDSTYALDSKIATKVETSAFEAKVAELNDAIEVKVDASDFTAALDDIDEKLDAKADKTALEEVKTALSGEIATKANISDITNIATAFNGELAKKAEASVVEDLITEVAAKADATKTESAISALEVLVNAKVNTADMQSAIEAVNSSIETVDAKFENKADKSFVESEDEAILGEVANKVGKDELIMTNTEIKALLARLASLENKVANLSENKVQVITDKADVLNGINKPEAYVAITGNIKPDTDSSVATPVSIVAKNVEMNDVEVSDNTRLSIKSANIVISDSVFKGEFPKSNGGNAMTSFNECSTVALRDITVENEGDANYNAFEIGLNSTNLPKSIVIDNCDFKGKLNNNAILIFGTDNDVTVTISNCHFENISNGLRISNKSNATGVTVNIVNCSVDQWEEGDYAGFLLFQDYTSKNAEETQENNLFGDGKVTVNFINLTYKGEKITSEYDGQIAYVYGNKVGLIKEAEYQPIINII